MLAAFDAGDRRVTGAHSLRKLFLREPEVHPASDDDARELFVGGEPRLCLAVGGAALGAASPGFCRRCTDRADVRRFQLAHAPR